MLPLSAAELAGIVGGSLSGDGAVVCRRVVTDTRTARRAGDVFFGLRGAQFDGARFAGAALAEGAAAAVLRSGAGVTAEAGAAVIEVDDPLAALQRLAAAERARFAGCVVAITGSNGKTTTKDMLAAALGESVRVCASPMSYNSQIGVALSLLSLDHAAAVALIECGISQPGEMSRLAAMVRPDVGVHVGVGDAHLAGFGTREVTAREKAALFAALPSSGWVVAPESDALAVSSLFAVGATIVPVAVGAPVASLDEPFATDAALALEAAERLGASRDSAARGLCAWRPAPMRLETAQTPRGVTLINDAYTADPASAEAALGVLVRGRGAGSTIAVLGGMDQLGAARVVAHDQLGRRVVELGVDRLIGVGDGGAEIVRAALDAGMPPQSATTVAAVDDAASLLESLARPGDRVLLKASRPERLERIAAVLFESVAPARAHVDLDRLVENLRCVRRAVGDGVAVMAVVKSFGYGLDAARTGVALQAAGVEHFCVAYADEGIELRAAGVTRPILVQNVVPEDAAKCAAHGLSAEVGSSDQLRHVSEAARAARRAVRVHVKVDSGMGRAGALPADAHALALAASADEWVTLDGLMTHFASADDPGADETTRAQIACFEQVRARLADAGVTPRWLHACNSHGLARFPEAHYTMVRPGIGLLGYAELDGAPLLGTQPVLRLTTRVIGTKTVPAGAAVGYGATWVSKRETRLALVAIGYGDGYPRALSSRGWMAVGGRPCPVVGRVSMDVTVLDVTDAVAGLPRGVEAGDEVVVFGDPPREPCLVDAARRADTIPYELLARISGRVRRIYASSHG